MGGGIRNRIIAGVLVKRMTTKQSAYPEVCATECAVLLNGLQGVV
jgi:hypothetical protein